MNENLTIPEIPPQAQPPPPKKPFGKKLYIIIGLIAVVAVASAFILINFMPKGLGATVSLGVNYNVGEKMTYQVLITMSMMGQTVTKNGTISIEVLSFDGENYTIQEKVRVDSQDFSFTVKMNKTGHIFDFTGPGDSAGLPQEFQQIYSSLSSLPGFGSYYPRLTARVGEGWQIPIDTQILGLNLSGTINYGISGVTDITVTAGTYKVFRIDISAINIHGIYQSSGVTVHLFATMNAYAYVENATSTPIEFNIQESVTASAMGQTVSMSMTILVRLKEHIR